MLLVFGAPCQLRVLAGPEHGQTIPLADMEGAEIPQCSGLLAHRMRYHFVAAQEGSAAPTQIQNDSGLTQGPELEEEKQRRIDEKIAKGEAIRVPFEAIRVPFLVVVGTPEEADAAIENGKARKLAEVREAGETREVYFEPVMGVEAIITGVPRAGRDAP